MKALVLGLMLGLAASQGAFAQSTSSAVNGRITDPEGRPIAGAVVEILHVPSNTRRSVVTDDQGRYSSSGLRVGGPYKITVTKEGFAGEAAEGVSLALGEASQINIDLDPAMTTLESVEVVASSQADIFSNERFGAGTSVSRETSNALPSIKRDLQDYARLDPRISQTDKERGEISALGQNSRFNSVTIDSVSTNDTFGLESNNLPTLRQPISMDAIESVQLNIVNVDVTQRGYTGANINAVTKSGTNDFHGSVYGTYRDSDMVRETDDRGVKFTGFDDDISYGATFGGPLIEDRLFFFVNYDKTEISAPGPDLSSGPYNRATNGISDAQLQEVISIARNVWGMEPGDLVPGALDTEVETWIARFDWNISDAHRAAFRYSRTEQGEAILPGFGNNFFSLSSHWYTQEKEFENYVLEVFSDWNERFSTEMRASYRDYFSTPAVCARQPQVQVDFGTASFRFGTEQFRHANVLETKTFNMFAAGNLFLDDHAVKFGADYESNDIYNLFLESNLGVYRFANTNDFRNGVYREYTYRAATSGNLNDAAAELELDNVGVFLQDTWSVNYNLTLTYGVRVDTPSVADAPPLNQRFVTAFGLRNNTTIDGNDLVQPRFGFNYNFDSERPTQLRGGVGLFQGAAANVWLSNPYTNNGLTIGVFGCGTAGLANCPATRPSIFVPNPDNQPPVVVGSGAPPADVDIVADDLHQPSVWKFNLAIEHELPWWGMVASAEAILTEVEDAVFYEHLNLGSPTRLGQDGRNMYWANFDPSRYQTNGTFNGTARSRRNTAFREVLLARPTNKGSGENFTLALTKPMNVDSNLFWQVAYSYTDATEVNGLTSSRAISNWASRSIFNPNEEVSSRSPYVNKDRFTGTLSYRHFFFEGYKTEFAMFYEGRRGKPYSWTFNNDMNGDGLAGNDLMYIPSGGEVTFTDPAEASVFAQLVEQYGLDRYAGGVVPRNEEYAPWVHNFDMRISQELPGFFAGNKAEIWLDVLNVGNLLNKDWGVIDEVGFQSNGGQARSFVNFAGINANGGYVYDVLATPEGLARRDRTAESRWALQLGFRYSF
ncbi:MAG: TonB-dependent receptor [Xanthomonadales bacterium]|nr:TonB-dependent receptor [Xanthomonadales bacterium]